MDSENEFEVRPRGERNRVCFGSSFAFHPQSRDQPALMAVSEECRFRKLLYVLVSSVIVRALLCSYMRTKLAGSLRRVGERFWELRFWHVIGWRPLNARKSLSDA